MFLGQPFGIWYLEFPRIFTFRLNIKRDTVIGDNVLAGLIDHKRLHLSNWGYRVLVVKQTWEHIVPNTGGPLNFEAVGKYAGDLHLADSLRLSKNP